MLQDQYRESSKIEKEYRKLLQAWSHELSNNPSTDIKKSKISKSEHIQFTLMHLFNGYLDRIWTDSQNMLQCAQAWTNQNTETYPSDAIFTMNILGLHLMKQSLRTRQEFFRIVDELNGILSAKDENESIFSASDSTISEESFLITHPTKYDHGYIDLEKKDLKADQFFCNDFYNLDYSEQLSKKELSIRDKKSAESITSIELDLPIKLTSSPSTPTISNSWSKMPPCHFKVSPVTTNNVDNISNGQVSQKRNIPCQICQEPLPFEESLSADNLRSLQCSTVRSTDDEEYRLENCSSFEVASYYYNSESDNEEDIIEREFLLEKPSESNLKVLMENKSGGSTSSSIIHYNTGTKQINKNKVRRTKQAIVHRRYGSSSTCLPQSTCSSLYSKDDENGEQTVCQSSEQKTEMKHTDVWSKIASLMKKSLNKTETDFTRKDREGQSNTLKYSMKNKFNICGIIFNKKSK